MYPQTLSHRNARVVPVAIHATDMDQIVKTSDVARKRLYQFHPTKAPWWPRLDGRPALSELGL